MTNPNDSFKEDSTDRFLDRWLTVRDGSSHPVVKAVLKTIGASEQRQRNRREDDRAVHERLVAVLVANLAHSVVVADAQRELSAFPAIVVPRAKPKAVVSRYEAKGFRKLHDIVDRLAALGVLEVWTSRERRVASTITPSLTFAEMARAANVTFSDLTRAPGEETIILTSTKRNYRYGSVERPRMEYQDTPETHRMRSELGIINDHLASADIGLEGDQAAVDLTAIRLRRSFKFVPEEPASATDFSLGGRLFGGWWQNLAKGPRHLIRIDGEPIADLDFASMFVRLAYLRLGVRPPDGDLYAIIEHINTPEHRDGVKMVVNAMLFQRHEMEKLPKDSRAMLPKRLRSVEGVREAILAAHGPLGPLFSLGIGHHLMRTESDLLVAILLELTAQSITALPMHDGVMVAASKADVARGIMGDISERAIGHRLPVERKA